MRVMLPAAQLVAMSIAGGPFPERHRERLRQRLPGEVLELDYEAEELISMRRWWLMQPPHPSDYQRRAQQACVAAIYVAFQEARLCLGCGRSLPSTHHSPDSPFCPECTQRASP